MSNIKVTRSLHIEQPGNTEISMVRKIPFKIGLLFILVFAVQTVLWAESPKKPAAKKETGDYTLLAGRMPGSAQRFTPDRGFIAHLVGQADLVKVYRVSPHYKVYPTDPVKILPGPLPRVELCRGEYEPFQIVVNSPRELKAVTVQMEGMPEGLTVQCQPVGVVNIKKSMVRAGLTPDPLHNDPKFDVAAGRNQSFWITLHAERSTKPGDYDLKGRLMAGTEVILAFSCPIRVWDFPMPKMPHLAYMCEYRPFNDNGRFKGLWHWPADRQAKLFRTYYQWYAKNRMQPGVIFPTFNATQNDKGQWTIVNRDAFIKNQREFQKEFPGIFQVMWQRWMLGCGNSYPEFNSKAGQERFEDMKYNMQLYVKLARENNLSLDRVVWYAGDEPICPHYDTRQQPIASINAYVRALRPYMGGIPVFASAWPFDRDLLSSVDIWSMRSDGVPGNLLERMPVGQAMNFGKCVALTLDNSDNMLMDRQSINHRIDPWHAWYANVPMLEYGMNQYWQMNPWDPKENWFTSAWPVPGDMNLTYPPPSEDQVVSCLRAELLREGMEDYEYLWLLRHASYVIRASEKGGPESDLLGRIDECLWDAWTWISDGTIRYKQTSYIGMCNNLKKEQIPELADRFDALRDRMGRTLEEVNRKGFFKESAIDTGHKLPREWFRYDNP
jgi:hypothetical protein